jgi:citrate lyase subunit beta/citryl-CoA lyase
MSGPDGLNPGSRRPYRQTLRSRLYVPGQKISWLQKAIASGTDAVILDLDDAVPAEDKQNARSDVAAAVADSADELPLFVRINDLTTGWALDDLEAVVRPGLFGLVVPRISDPSQIMALDLVLSWLESRAGMTEGTVVLSPIFETAASIHFAYEISKVSSRVDYVGGIASEGGDVEREIGYRWSRSAWESVTLRSNILLEVRAAGVAHPMTGIWTALDDADGLIAFAEQGRAIGYEGMDVIHPSHVAIVHAAFGITQDRIDEARRIVDVATNRTETALESVDGDDTALGAVRFEGRMIDTAMVRTATEILRRHDEIR